MIRGVDHFAKHFADYEDQYILIGGTACTLVMEKAGKQFRSTQDLDIVLCMESFNSKFAAAFWKYIHAGNYDSQEGSNDKKQFYRFKKPANDDYPLMLELFSRIPDALSIAEESRFTPIPTEEDISSLSAILLNDDYYHFLQSGKKIVNDLPVVGEEYLIPLKAKAWLDLSQRKADGKKVKKHMNDVFRLYTIIDPEFSGEIPSQIKSDLLEFINQMKGKSIDIKAFGIKSETTKEVLAELQRIYKLK